MRNLRKLAIIALTSLVAACVSPSGGSGVKTGDNRPRYDNPPPRNNPAPTPQRNTYRTQPNPALVAEIADIWRSFPGKTGIAVKRIDGDWEIGQRIDEAFPQQSVSKLWVSLTLLNKIDEGRASLSDPIRIGPDDLTLFHQPLAAEVAQNGAVTKTVYTLMEQALARSDNTANDSLLRHAGGPDAVNNFIARSQLGKIQFAQGERLMQSKIAGINWDQSLSQGRRFYTARANVPVERRTQALNDYLANPYDGASPGAIVNALGKLARGELLSPNSTKLIMSILSRTRSGPNRLKAGVPSDWQFMHKTGTGQVLGSVSTGYNDVGIMTAPDGTRYAVAVMIADTTASIPERMRMMQSVTRAVARYHQQ